MRRYSARRRPFRRSTRRLVGRRPVRGRRSFSRRRATSRRRVRPIRIGFRRA